MKCLLKLSLQVLNLTACYGALIIKALDLSILVLYLIRPGCKTAVAEFLLQAFEF